MGYKKPSFIEGIAEKLGIIPNLHKEGYQEIDNDMRHFTDEEVAQMYSELLAKTDGLEIPYASPQVKMSWFVYVVRLASGVDRDRVMARLEEKGVASRAYFSPIHLQPFYRRKFGSREGDFPVTEAVARSTLALPFHSNLDEESVEYVCSALSEIITAER